MLWKQKYATFVEMEYLIVTTHPRKHYLNLKKSHLNLTYFVVLSLNIYLLGTNTVWYNVPVKNWTYFKFCSSTSSTLDVMVMLWLQYFGG